MSIQETNIEMILQQHLAREISLLTSAITAQQTLTAEHITRRTLLISIAAAANITLQETTP